MKTGSYIDLKGVPTEKINEYFNKFITEQKKNPQKKECLGCQKLTPNFSIFLPEKESFKNYYLGIYFICEQCFERLKDDKKFREVIENHFKRRKEVKLTPEQLQKRIDELIKKHPNIQGFLDDKKGLKKKIKEEFIREIIRPKLNWRELTEEEIKEDSITFDGISVEYDGLDMSGYGNSHFYNMGILSRFKNYSSPFGELSDSIRNPNRFIPLFWKGSGEIVNANINSSYNKEMWNKLLSGRPKFSSLENNNIGERYDLGGITTEEIILEVIENQNPNLLKDYYELNRDKFTIEEEIERDLSELVSEEESEQKQVIISRLKRNNGLVRELKERYKKCQLCGFTFKKKDGKNYVEIHHIIPLSKKGIDKKKNTLVLCANCHRKMHFADVSLSLYEKNDEIIINNITFKITRI